MRIEYTIRTTNGIRNVSRTKSGTKDLIEEYQLSHEHTFENYVYLADIYTGLLESDDMYLSIDSQTTFTFSGSLKAKIN